MERLKKEAEIWKSIPGIRGYEVSDRGVVRCWFKPTDSYVRRKNGIPTKYYANFVRMERPKVLDWITDPIKKQTFVRVISDGRYCRRQLEKLVAAAFDIVQPLGNYGLVHKNFSMFDFRPSNLAWRRKKSRAKSPDQGKAKIDAERAREIRILLYKGIKPKAIASHYSISTACVSQVRNGARWPSAGGPIETSAGTINEGDLDIDPELIGMFLEDQEEENDKALKLNTVEDDF